MRGACCGWLLGVSLDCVRCVGMHRIVLLYVGSHMHVRVNNRCVSRKGRTHFLRGVPAFFFWRAAATAAMMSDLSNRHTYFFECLDEVCLSDSAILWKSVPPGTTPSRSRRPLDHILLLLQRLKICATTKQLSKSSQDAMVAVHASINRVHYC